MISRRLFLGGLASLVATPIIKPKKLFFFDTHYQIAVDEIKVYKYPPLVDQDTGFLWKAIYNKPHQAINSIKRYDSIYTTYANLNNISDKEVKKELIISLNKYWQDCCQPIG